MCLTLTVPDLAVCLTLTVPDLAMCLTLTVPDLEVCLTQTVSDLAVCLSLTVPDLAVCLTVPILTLKVDVLGGMVKSCGKLNTSKVTYDGESGMLAGTIHCSTSPSKPDGHIITMTALFEDGSAVGTLQLCDIKVKGAPHTGQCP